MKNFKKIISVFICVILVLCFVSCNDTQNENQKQVGEEGELQGVLDIASIDLGFGVQWLNNLIEGFTAKHPKVTVNTRTSTITSKINLYLTTSRSNPYDIIFTETSQVFGYATTPYTITGIEYCYEDLTDVYESVYDGEEIAIKDKMNTDIYEYFQSQDGKYYAIPWATTLFGLMYNTDLIDDSDIPKTTNELVDFCENFNSTHNDKHAIIWTKDAQYWDQIIETWWAQYQGKKEFTNFYYGKVNDEYSVDVFKQNGRLKALEVLSSLIDYNNGFADPDSSGLEFIPAQTRLMNGEAAIMPNGSWIENEMDNFFPSGTAPVNYMRTPIISSIVETLEYRGAGSTESNPVYMTDTMLSSIITAIDDGETEFEGVSDNDFNTIRSARTMYFIENVINTAVVPSFSNAKILAKEFLKYMYSDEGIQRYTAANSGGSLPVYYDYSDIYSDFSSMQKQRLDVIGSHDTNIIFRPRNRALLFISFRTSKVQTKLGSISDVMTPQQIFDFDYNYYTANNNSAWNNLLITKGINLGE